MPGISRKDFAPGYEPIERGLSTNRPSNPVTGRLRWETDTTQAVVFTGSTWDAISIGAGAAADIVNVISTDKTIANGTSVYYPQYLEIASGANLELAADGWVEVG